VTTSANAAATAGWVDANLATLAEFNAGRKILMRQLEDVSTGLGNMDDLRVTASELQAIALLLRALPPVPQAVADSTLRAAVDAFASAVTVVLRSSQSDLLSGPVPKVLEDAAVYLLQANAHYRAATSVLNNTVASRVAAGST
jgi:hypothetical protein